MHAHMMKTFNLTETNKGEVHRTSTDISESKRHTRSCFRCGGPHLRRFIKGKCHNCEKIGHIAKSISRQAYKTTRSNKRKISPINTCS